MISHIVRGVGGDTFCDHMPCSGGCFPAIFFFSGASVILLIYSGIRFMYFIVFIIICSFDSRRHATMRYTGTVGSFAR